MNRRAFLSLIATGLVGAGADLAGVDLDRLLWVPGEKTIFLPPAFEIGANCFVTPDWIVRESLRRLKNNAKFAAEVSRSYDGPFVGQTITARLPVRYQVGAR